MEFYTCANYPRPVRLSEGTRRFAYESLECKYGLEAMKTPCVVMDDVAGFDNMSNLERYNACISEMVRQAPVRVCEGEMLSGAATLGMAISHNIPAKYRGGRIFTTISHLTIDFETTLKYGVNKISADIDSRLADTDLTQEQLDFLNSAKHCVNEMRIWHAKYTDALAKLPGYEANLNNLRQVPFEPARNFYEAVQSIWFVFAFVRLCGNWPGIGRQDELLGGYLRKDLESGSITLEEAREILAHFFIKGCEWICGGDYRSGDAQHYQNIVLAGVNARGEEVTNEVTYLILDILEELNISDFPTTVRINSRSDEKLLRRVAEVMKHGGGVLAVYNEDKIIESLTTHGYPLEEARQFANDGCWEIQIPGKTYFSYTPFDALQILLNDTLKVKEGGAHFESYAQVREKFLADMEAVIRDMSMGVGNPRIKKVPDDDWKWRPQMPCTVISLFEKDCIRKAASYLDGGTVYRVLSPHIGGAADVGNSLRVLDKLCFQDKTIALQDFLKILQNNWEGSEPLRQMVLNKISCYGNDDDEADAYTIDVVDSFANIVLKYNADTPFLYVPGASTFGSQAELRHVRPATPHGHRTGDILAPNMGATPGSDMQGPTALIKSYCKLNLANQVTGAALDVKLLPSAVKGENGTQALVALMRGFVALGGCFMQPDVVDNSVLKDAQEHPENYSSLSVRVSGWNARFVTMNREWQDMVIEKTAHGGM